MEAITINYPSILVLNTVERSVDVGTYVVLLRNALDERYYLPAGGGIKTTSRFIQEQQLRACDQLAGNTNSPLLTPTDPLPNRSPNERIALVTESECIEQAIYTIHSL